ncbi:MAG: hypothetical protein JWR39_797 [Devosia sp.]|nr:hypothetical protein [Devosia sp.]
MRADKSRLQGGWRRQALISASSIALLLAAAPAMAETPLPSVEGPIPVTDASPIFTTGGTDLEAHGYEIEEYLVSGAANVYDWGADGAAQEPQVVTADAPYTTRMIVRRPADPADFSGTVWVELNNPSRGWDVEVQWPAIQDKVMRDGDIWVSMTAKPNVIASLQRIDPARYGKLAMTNPLPPEQQKCGLLPQEQGYDENLSKLYENGLVWDMISQVGALVRDTSANAPLAGYNVQHVFGTGESQTGFFLNTYANNFANAATLADGSPVYEGFLSASGAGRTVPISQCLAAMPADDPRGQLPAEHVPFIRADAQGDIFLLGSYDWRREDSDDPKAGYRIYEIAGAPHGPAFITNYQPDPEAIKRAGDLPTQVAYEYGGSETTANHLPRQYIEPAMYANLEKWVIEGTLPPKSTPIATVEGESRSLSGVVYPVAFETDEHGNVLGGVRSPYLDVPTATYFESATPVEGLPYAWSFGHQVDFGTAKLHQLYGVVGAYQNYVSQVRSSVDQLLAEGWLLPEDAERIVTEAELRSVP